MSVGQYLPTLFAGNGRVATLTTEAVTLAAGADRRVIGVYAVAAGAAATASSISARSAAARRCCSRTGAACTAIRMKRALRARMAACGVRVELAGRALIGPLTSTSRRANA